jgi:uncharacterized protein YndB with AHSA1/START domain
VVETIFIVVVLLIIAVGIYAATRPNRFRLERSMMIDAPPETIFPLIADFQQWPQWSPWEGLDPDLRRTYSGAAHGVGAIYEYEGNNKVGAGRMEIVEATPYSRVTAKLDFLKPIVAHNIAEWTLAPEGRGGRTKVTWAMHGPQNFVSKLMGLFMSVDRMVGGQFEKGLANLKRVAEGKS